MTKPKPTGSERLKSGPISAGRVKSFVERIERLEEERRAIGADVRDVYAEAKGVGYDVKTLRWMVQERKVDAVDRDERDLLRDTYAHALGLAVVMVRVEGLSLRQAEDATGVSKSSIQRALAVPEVSREMTSDDLGDPLLLEQREIDDALAEEKLAALIAEMNGLPMPSSAPVAASGKEDLGVAAGAGPFGSQETTDEQPDDCGVEPRPLPEAGRCEPAGVGEADGDLHGERGPGLAAEWCDVPALPSPQRGLPAACAAVEAQEVSPVAVGVDPRPEGAPIPDDLTIPAHLDQRKRQVHA